MLVVSVVEEKKGKEKAKYFKFKSLVHCYGKSSGERIAAVFLSSPFFLLLRFINFFSLFIFTIVSIFGCFAFFQQMHTSKTWNGKEIKDRRLIRPGMELKEKEEEEE